MWIISIWTAHLPYKYLVLFYFNMSLSLPSLFIAIASFLTGFLLCSTIFLYNTRSNQPKSSVIQNSLSKFTSQTTSYDDKFNLQGLSILVGIASYNFNQLPHLEEVLQSYRDICEAGAKVDVVIHTAVPYPVVFIDLLNSRLKCVNPSPDAGFSIKIVGKITSTNYFSIS